MRWCLVARVTRQAELRGYVNMRCCCPWVVRFGLLLPFTVGSSIRAQDAPSEPPTQPAATSTIEAAAPEPKAPPKRAEFIANPGAPRKPLPGLFDSKVEVAQEPRSTERQFDEVRQGRTPLTDSDKKVIDDWAKFHAYELTKKGNDAVVTILKTVATAKDASGRVSADFVKAYKSSVIKHLKKLLDNSVYVQINALFTMSELQNRLPGDVQEDVEREVPDVTDAVPVFVEVVLDDKRTDAAVLMALQGIMRAKQCRPILISPTEEQKIVYRILDRIGDSSIADDVQPVLYEKMLETLGVLGRVHAQTSEDVKVATFLGNVALDPNATPRVRFEAARALARLNSGDVPQWNSQLQAYILAAVLKENQQTLAAMDPDGQYQAFLWLDAILSGSATDPSGSTGAYPALAQILKEKVLGPIINSRLNDGKGPEFELLDAWMTENPIPETHSFGPRGAEISLPSSEPAKEEAAEDSK